MKRRDIIFLATTLSAVVAASVLLALSYRYDGKGAQTEQIATITFKKKTAQRKFFQQPVWELLYKDSPVYNKDKIRTSNDSLSIVHLENDIDLELDENTLIYLDLTDGNTNVTFQHGSIYTKNSGGASIRIYSGETSITLDGGNALLTRDETDGAISVNVHEGTADIDSNGEVTRVSQNQMARIEEDRVSVEEYTVTLTSPVQNSFFVTDDHTFSVQFTWNTSRSGPYVLSVARDFSFADTVHSEETDAQSMQLAVEPGEYYWKISGTAGETKSPVYKVTVLHDYPVIPQLPQSGTQYSYFRNPPPVHFVWSRSPLATEYRLVLSKSVSFDDIYLTHTVSSHTLTVDSLEEGEYHWRVTALYGFGQQESSLRGEARRFSVRRSDTIAPPELSAPKADRAISSDFFHRNALTFSWEPNNDIESYMLEVAEDSHFTDPLHRTETGGTLVRISRPLPPGRYFWRLSYYDAAKDARVVTAPREFTVEDATTISLEHPSGDAQTGPEREIRLRWDDTSSWNRYRVELSTDESFDSPIAQQETSSNRAVITVPEEDTYYWRVSRLNPDGSVRQSSGPSSFTVAERASPAPETAFSSPGNGSSVNLDRQNSITFTWTDTGSEVLFALEEAESGNEIFRDRSRGNRLVFNRLTQLSRGRYRALILDPETEAVLARTGFTIALTPLPQPELLTDHIFLPEEE